MRKVIITAAIVGSTPTKKQSRAIPITPQEIAESAVAAHRAGASVVHIHVRDPDSGEHTDRLELFREVVERIRSESEVILNLTTSFGGTLVIHPDASIDNAKSSLKSSQKRVNHILAIKPELCSLDIATMNFGWRVFANVDGVVEKMAELIRESGTKPEIELFDIGHIEIAKRLLQKGLIKGRPHFQLCMGTAGSLAATPKNAVHFVELLPHPCTWSIFGVGKAQFAMVAMGVLLGGHVRVGLEDNLYLKKGIKAKSNAQLVERAVDIIHSLNKEVATVEEARGILLLKAN